MFRAREIIIALGLGLFTNLSAASAEDSQIPPILPVEAFADPPTFSNVKLSPDGQQIVFFSSQDGRRIAVAQGLDGRNPLLIPPYGEADITRIDWATDDRLLILYSLAIKRRIFGQKLLTESRLASLTRDGSNLEWIVRPQKKKGRGGGGGLTPPFQDGILSILPDDTNHILLALDEDLDGETEIRRIDIRNGRYRDVKGG